MAHASELEALRKQIDALRNDVWHIADRLQERKQSSWIALVAIAALIAASGALGVGVTALTRHDHESGVNVPNRDVLRPLLEKTSLSDADKDRVADLAVKEMLDVMRRDPGGEVARILSDWLATPDSAGESSTRTTEAARPHLQNIFRRAAEAAELPANTVSEVAAAVSRAPFLTLQRIKQELTSGLLGAIGGIPIELLLKLMEPGFGKSEVTCNLCNSCADKAGPRPPPQDGAVCPNCPVCSSCPACPASTDPRSFEFRFVPGRYDLPSDARDGINVIARDALERPSAKVLVWGHTDTVGSKAANALLAGQRADAVVQALIDAKVPRESIQAFALGEYSLLHPTRDGKDEPGNRVAIVALGYR